MQQRGCQSVGIDLGTTYSSIAYLDNQLLPRIVQDSSGKPVIPSAIYFDDGGIIVGDMALQQAKMDASRVVQFVKVHMGDNWRREFQGHEYTPESLSAIILSHLIQEAEPQIGPIKSAVITVPAYFTEKRRRATQQAGEIAGLEVTGILNEPMAATLAYGIYREEQEQNVVVYDLGGGTFDVTINRISPDEIVELATDGNRQLGGKDWDEQLLEIVLEDFKRAHGEDAADDQQAIQDLRIECEIAKRQLSKISKTAIRFFACGRQHTTEVTREQFEQATRPLLKMTKLTVDDVMDSAGLTWKDINRVVLVGGSTYMPAVRQMLEETAGFPPDTGVSPVMAVALGAAIYAQMRETGHSLKPVVPLREEASAAATQREQPKAASHPQGSEPAVVSEAGAATLNTDELQRHDRAESNAEETRTSANESAQSEPAPPAAAEIQQAPLPEVRFVTAHGVGVKALGDDGWQNAVLIHKNTPVPSRTSQRFRTTSETGGATYLVIEITQGDTTELDLAEVLGEGRIEGLPLDESPGQAVDVNMEFDETGRLHVKAVYVNTGQELDVSLDIPGGLQPEEVEKQREHLEKACFLRI